MDYILYIVLAVLVPILSSAERPARRKWGLKRRVDLTSSAKMAQILKHLAKRDHPGASGIDMDYFGASGEQIERINKNKRDKDVGTPLEADRFYSPKNRVRLIYVSNPEVLEQYKKKLKKIRVEREPLSEEDGEKGVSYKDILQFLVQVDARLREREGRPKNEVPILTPPKLNYILDNMRRYIDKNNEENEDIEPTARMRENVEEKQYKGHTFAMIRDKPSLSERDVYESSEIRKRKEPSEENWNKRSMERDSWKKMSDVEDMPTTPGRSWKRGPEKEESREKGAWSNNVDRFRQKPMKKGKVPNFISTPIPMSGRQGVYEDDK